MKKYKAGDRMNYTVTEGNYLRFGLQSVKDGVIFTFAGEKEDVKDGKTGKSIGWKYKGKNGIKSLFMKTEVMGIPITGITFSWGDM